jgi:hypothetical protein
MMFIVRDHHEDMKDMKKYGVLAFAAFGGG